MQRSSKKAGRKPGTIKQKQPDFKKKRNKVGKSTRKENETITSFKTRAIRVASSLREVDRSKEIVTQHGQTVSDLLAKVGHYNDSMRVDAIHGLATLIQEHPYLLKQAAVLLRIIERVCQRISDESSRVRKETAALLRTIASTCGQKQLTPYFPLLVAHTSTALTSIDHYIRRDALNVVDVWIEHAPQLLGQMGHNLIGNFLHLVSSQTRKRNQAATVRQLSGAPSSKLSSAEGRVAVLRRLNKFTQIALSTYVPELSAMQGKSLPLTRLSFTQTCVNTTGLYASTAVQWVARPATAATATPNITDSGSTSSTHGGKLTLLAAATTPAAPRSSHTSGATTTLRPEASASSLSSHSNAVEATTGSMLMSPPQVLLYAKEDLWPVVDQAWLELVSERNEAGVAADTKQDTLAVVSTLVDLTLCILQFLEEQGHSALVVDMRGSAHDESPADNPQKRAKTKKNSKKKKASSQSSQLTCGDLLPVVSALFFERFPMAADACFGSGPNAATLLWLNTRVARMMAIAWLWTTRLCTSNAAARTRKANKGSDARVHFAWADALQSFLQKAIANANTRQEGVLQHVLQTVVLLSKHHLLGGDVLDAVAKLHASVPLTSSHKRLTFQVLAGMLRWSSVADCPSDIKVTCHAWAKTLPRLLWELKTTDSDFSHDVLIVLHLIVCCKLLPAVETVRLSKQLTRLLITTAKAKEFAGPFHKLPESVQQSLLDVLSYCDAAAHDIGTIASRSCRLLRVDRCVQQRLIRLALRGRGKDVCIAKAAASFLLALDKDGAGVDPLGVCKDAAVLSAEPRVCPPLSLHIQQGHVHARSLTQTPEMLDALTQAQHHANVLVQEWCTERYTDDEAPAHHVVRLLQDRNVVPFDRLFAAVLFANTAARLCPPTSGTPGADGPGEGDDGEGWQMRQRLISYVGSLLCFHALQAAPTNSEHNTSHMRMFNRLLDLALECCNGSARGLQVLFDDIAGRLGALGAARLLKLVSSLCRHERILTFLRETPPPSLPPLLDSISSTHEHLTSEVDRLHTHFHHENVQFPTQ